MNLTEDYVVYIRTVRVGCIIKSPEFDNLLYRDIINQDPMLGFFVNPLVRVRDWDNTTKVVMLESAGRIKRSGVGPREANNYVNLKKTGDHDAEFVVIYTQRNTDCIPELLKDNEVIGTHPLMVVAKQLSPDGNYDPDGIEITFHMESQIAKHLVPEVISCGFMNVTFKRTF
jgi:hypothetical protein